MKNKTLSARLLAVMIFIMGLGLVTNSCKQELTDDTEFNIFYPGLTDIGPSMSCTIPLGSYIGSQPSDFKITRITFNGSAYDNAGGVFSIDSEKGNISVSNSSSLAVGKYSLSISCVSGGKTWDFPDIITINMMKPVPEEIKVEPSEITIKLSDIKDGYFIPEENTATIISDSEAISITNYEISEIKLDGEVLGKSSLFKVSSSGVVTIDPDENTTPGVYCLSFKLRTILSGDDEQEGLFVDALTVNITSAPTAITYPFLPVKVETNGIERISETPKVTGSQKELKFELTAINPDSGTEFISIDEATGAIKVKAGHPFATGEIFDLDINVTNDNGSTLFTNACQIEVVAKVNEIKGFSYEKQEIVRGAGFSVEKTMEAGDEVTYSFENLPAELSVLNLDAETGIITLPKGNNVPEGNYTVKVTARNYKGSMTAELEIVISKNPYYFTTVSWGTNLTSDKSDKACENQFRFPVNTNDIAEIGIVTDDMTDKSKMKFTIKALTPKAPAATISAAGAIKFSSTRLDTQKDGKTVPAERRVDIYLVTVTNGAGENGEISKEIPVFLHSSETEGNTGIQYTPIVCKINPKTGGTTHGIDYLNFNEADKAKLLVDYRRNFNYYNLGGPASHVSGTPSDAGSFMRAMWDFYWLTTINHTSSNYGAKAPMSYCLNSGTVMENSGDDPKTLAMPLGYVNPDKGFGVTINPRKFTMDGAWANGLLIGQMTWIVNSEDKGEKEIEEALNKVGDGPGRVSPIVIWFDPNYEN